MNNKEKINLWILLIMVVVGFAIFVTFAKPISKPVTAKDLANDFELLFITFSYYELNTTYYENITTKDVGFMDPGTSISNFTYIINLGPYTNFSKALTSTYYFYFHNPTYSFDFTYNYQFEYSLIQYFTIQTINEFGLSNNYQIFSFWKSF